MVGNRKQVLKERQEVQSDRVTDVDRLIAESWARFHKKNQDRKDKMQITSGRVLYSRVVQATQFEPKKAEVELSFSLAEGEVLADALDEVGRIVQEKALALVGLRLKRD